LQVFNTIAALQKALDLKRAENASVALVPTMGALHKGHLSLIAAAQKQAQIVVCSIFVNPTQFTDPQDLEKYPRPLAHDIDLLENAGCDFLFMPAVKEMYPGFPEPENWHIDLGPAEFVLEGEFRKGHYQGVTQIVKKLFDAVKPDLAFFGQKDFQQVLMIKNMVNYFNLTVEVVTCPIIREENGLAMSSRNIHLTATDVANALVLSEALFYISANFAKLPIDELLNKAKQMVASRPAVDLDYLVIANANTLLPVADKLQPNIVALIAAKVGATRLIDNIIVKTS
jgi:pantoate--beta-alanine ligase